MFIKSYLEKSSFKLHILISDIGGVAQLLMDLYHVGDFSRTLSEEHIDQLGSLMVNKISS